MHDFRFFPLREKARGDEGIRALARLASAKEADGSRWQQIAYEGEWLGHSSGEFQLTADIFDQVIANFNRRDDDVPVVHGHPGVGSDQAAYLGAAGWISELRRDVDEKGRQALFARIKWTPRTASKIEADEYRYCSVVIAFDSVDEVSGENIGPELLELGIVPAAFLDGMSRLAASRAGRAQPRALARKDKEMTDKELIAKAMKELGEDFTIEQLLAVVEAEKQKQAALDGAAPSEEEAPAGDVEASDAPDDVEVVQASDMPADASEEVAPDAEAEAARGAAADALEAMATEMGLDLPALLASLEEQRDAVMAALSGAPAEGTPAEDGAAPMAAMSKSHAKTIAELGKVSKRVQELEAKAEARELELSLARFDAKLSKHVADCDITDTEAAAFRDMSTDEDYGAPSVSLTVATKALSKRLEGAPAAPKSLAYKPAKPGANGKAPTVKERIADLSDRQRVFFETAKGLGKNDADAITFALEKSA